MQFFIMKYFLYLLVTTSFFLTSASTFADNTDQNDSEGNSEQIVVTGKKQQPSIVENYSTVGTKTNTALKEVPQSITVITRQQMDDQNVRTVSEALAYSAGVSAGSRPGGRFARASICFIWPSKSRWFCEYDHEKSRKTNIL